MPRGRPLTPLYERGPGCLQHLPVPRANSNHLIAAKFPTTGVQAIPLLSSFDSQQDPITESEPRQVQEGAQQHYADKEGNLHAVGAAATHLIKQHSGRPTAHLRYSNEAHSNETLNLSPKP